MTRWSILWSLLALLALGLSVYALRVSWPVLFPSVTEVEPDRPCDLRAGPCVSSLPGGGVVNFSIGPREIPLLKPLSLEVMLEGESFEAVAVDIVGLNMDMGLNRTRLQSASPSLWRGTTVLPVCSRQAMLWQASVMLENNGKIVSVLFPFQTFRAQPE